MTASRSRDSTLLTRSELCRIRAKAFRRRVWFKALTRTERQLINLTIRVVEKVRSFHLARLLTSIIGKLLTSMKSKIARMMEEVGPSLALKASRTAQSWGNDSAVRWMKDRAFIRYLTVMHVNTPGAFKG